MHVDPHTNPVARLYEAVVDARDNLGMTQEDFRKICARRPMHYAPVTYLANVDEFWEKPTCEKNT